MTTPGGTMTWADLPGITLRPLASAALDIDIGSSRTLDAQTEAAIDAAWARAKADNPRLYDGPMLHVDAVDAERGVITTRRERYRRLVGGPAAGVGVRLLAVTGVVVGQDASGAEHALFGRRGGETRIYPGLWEFGPSGGIPCPAESVTRLDLGDVRAALIGEGREELGVDLAAAACTPVAIIGDDEAASEDIVLWAQVPGVIDPRRTPCRLDDAESWEYLDTAWVPVERLIAWLAQSPAAFIPPTVALIRHLHRRPDHGPGRGA